MALLFKLWGNSAFGMGLLSVFLPCGWLHSFVLGAAATQSALQGALLLTVFWLGSVPALVATPVLVNRFFRPLAEKMPKVAAVLLMAAGVSAVGYKAFPLTRHYSEKLQTVLEEKAPLNNECPYHKNQKK